MFNVISFKPRRELDAQANLAAFISLAREKLTAFGADLSFDDVVWDVTTACPRKGRGNARHRITFCTMDSASSKQPVPLSDAFLPFAQAYIRQMQVLRPVVSLGQRMAALRALGAALSENNVALSPVNVDVNVLNRAAQLLKQHFSVAAAYKNGVQLEIIAEFLAKNRLIVSPLKWRNPLKRPLGGTRVGQEFDEKRARMMPSEAALEALPYIYRNATEPRDVLVSATAAIFCSAPDRISEVLSLPKACETPGHVEGDSSYGLRWWPAKGAEPMVKWVLPSMIDLVKDALAKIRRITEPAREIARWYEMNPDRLFLPQALEGLRSCDELSMEQLRAILWGERGSVSNAYDWCRYYNLSLKKCNDGQFIPFLQVEKTLLSMLPSAFPVFDSNSGLVYSKALMIVPKNMFGLKRLTYSCMIEPVVIQNINDGLGAGSRHGKRSIFDAFNCTEPDDSPIKVTSHQFRHYLNTLAQAGGLSQLDIAKWSGRKDIKQNEAYDHVSADEMLQIIRESVGDLAKAVGPLAVMPPQYLIKRDEFSRLMIPTAHTTDLGYCVHDYTMAPCQVHLDCVNCQEHICVKGDVGKTARLHQQLEEAQNLMAQAEVASQEDYAGSDKWLEHHKLTTERLRQLCEIMNNPKVPSGAIIQLNNVKSASRIEQAAMARAQLPSLLTDGAMLEDIQTGLSSGEKSA